MSATTTCRGCGQLLPAGIAFCQNCGVRATEQLGPVAPSPQSGSPSTGASAATTAVATVPAPVDTQPLAASAIPAPSAYSEAPPVYSEPYEPSMSRQDRRRRLIMFAAMGILLGFVGRIAWAATSTPGADQGELVAQLPIDPNGGETSFDNGAGKISVPKGAVSKRETVRIYKRVVTERVSALPPSGGQALVFPAGTLVVYIFQPITIRLLAPVTVTLAIPPGQRGLVFVTAQGQIRFLPGVGTGRTVTLVLNSFDLSRPGAVVVRG